MTSFHHTATLFTHLECGNYYLDLSCSLLFAMSLSKQDLEDITKILKGEFATIKSKLNKMEAQLDTTVAKNKELKTMETEKDIEIRSLKAQLNSVEQNTTVLGAFGLWASP